MGGMCNLRTLLYPIIIFESIIIGCFLYAVILYGEEQNQQGPNTPWEITTVLITSLVILVLGFGGVIALSIGHNTRSFWGLLTYIVWAIVFHLTVGPCVGSWTLYEYIARGRRLGRRVPTSLDYFFIGALILQFILGAIFVVIVFLNLRQFRKRKKVLGYRGQDVVSIIPTRRLEQSISRGSGSHFTLGTHEVNGIDVTKTNEHGFTEIGIDVSPNHRNQHYRPNSSSTVISAVPETSPATTSSSYPGVSHHSSSSSNINGSNKSNDDESSHNSNSPNKSQRTATTTVTTTPTNNKSNNNININKDNIHNDNNININQKSNSPILFRARRRTGGDGVGGAENDRDSEEITARATGIRSPSTSAATSNHQYNHKYNQHKHLNQHKQLNHQHKQLNQHKHPPTTTTTTTATKTATTTSTSQQQRRDHYRRRHVSNSLADVDSAAAAAAHLDHGERTNPAGVNNPSAAGKEKRQKNNSSDSSEQQLLGINHYYPPPPPPYKPPRPAHHAAADADVEANIDQTRKARKSTLYYP